MKKSILVLMIAVFGFCTAYSQKEDKKNLPKEMAISIKLDKLCCQSSVPLIEKTLAYEKGVKNFEVSLETHSVRVVYNPKKTNAEKIAKALAENGIEANGIEADKRAIDKLPTCCKNTAKGLSSGCHHKE